MASSIVDFTTPFQDIIVNLDGSVAIITLNRTKKRNTFTLPMAREIISVLELCDKDDRVSVVLLTAEPTAPAFCSGLDLAGIESATANTNFGGMVALAVHRCRKITISAVNGHAAGAGMTALQLPFDFRFAWSGAKFAFPFVRIGIAPEGLCSTLLPRLVGESRAKALLLSGLPVAADSHLLQGLYFRLFERREDVFPAALKFAKELGKNTSQVAAAFTKAMVNYPGETVEATHVLESKVLLELAHAEDFTELLTSFSQKRAPKMRGTVGKHTTKLYPWWDNAKL